MKRTNPIDNMRPLLAALLAGLLLLAGCGGADDTASAGSEGSASSGGGTLNLVAYSTPEVVYDEIIPDFQKTPEGKGVKFKTSFGASGEQSRAVEARPAGRRRLVLDRARHDAPRRGRPRRRRLEAAPTTTAS